MQRLVPGFASFALFAALAGSCGNAVPPPAGHPGPAPQTIAPDPALDVAHRAPTPQGSTPVVAPTASATASVVAPEPTAPPKYRTPLGPGSFSAPLSARRAWATYMVRMHNRLHPVFSDRFLASLSALPLDNPLSSPALKTKLEVVLDTDGSLARISVLSTSGVTAFDAGVLDSFHAVVPFGPTPAAIRSDDGYAYLTWVFFRKPEIACSTMNTMPFVLPAELDR